MREELKKELKGIFVKPLLIINDGETPKNINYYSWHYVTRVLGQYWIWIKFPIYLSGIIDYIFDKIYQMRNPS
jgi:hypothetical protein